MDTQTSASDDLWSYFVPVVLGGVALLGLILVVVLILWVRNSDLWRPVLSNRWRDDRWNIHESEDDDRPSQPPAPPTSPPPSASTASPAPPLAPPPPTSAAPPAPAVDGHEDTPRPPSD